ncbi:10451_t:CDS:2, partial [Dentiscutata heterogama]
MNKRVGSVEGSNSSYLKSAKSSEEDASNRQNNYILYYDKKIWLVQQFFLNSHSFQDLLGFDNEELQINESQSEINNYNNYDKINNYDEVNDYNEINVHHEINDCNKIFNTDSLDNKNN